MFDDFEQDLLGCQRVGKSRRPSNTCCMQCEWHMYFVVSMSDKTCSQLALARLVICTELRGREGSIRYDSVVEVGGLAGPSP